MTARGDPAVNPAADCPHCGAAIDPPPKRSRKCPACRGAVVVRRGHLLTEGEAAEFEGRLAAGREADRGRKREERFREWRGRTAEEVREARSSGVVSGMKPLVSSDACRVCQKVRDKVFPIGTCTAEMLPPYPDCEHDDGCDSAVVSVLGSEYGGPPGARRAGARPVPLQPDRLRGGFSPGRIFVALVVAVVAIRMGIYALVLLAGAFGWKSR